MKKDQDIIENAAKVTSMAGLLRALGLKEAGGNYANMRRKLQKLGIDTSHWTGSAWSKDKQVKDWSDYTNVVSLKKHLILLRGNKCECCKLETWLDRSIVLEVHHINGDRTNNALENLQLLCPNCHSFTDNWRRRK